MVTNKPQCGVDGCEVAAYYAVNITLSIARGVSATLELPLCKKHTEQHENAIRRVLPRVASHGN